MDADRQAPVPSAAISRPVGIVVAVEAERAILRKVMRSWAGLVPSVTVSGMGQAAAEGAAEGLAAGGVCGLMSFGYAGAIRSGLRRGTIIIADQVQTEDGELFSSDADWRGELERSLASRAGVTVGSFLSLGQVADSPAEKRRLATRFNALAVDMESAAVARVAARHGLPFIALRAIVDEAHHWVPSAAAAAVDRHGRSRPWRVALPLLRQPAQIGALMTLARGAGAADRSLADACRLAGPGFGLL
ncbi:MAG: hypothetical protein AB7S41_19040 [Parvibaculaceae bacterium]